MSLFRAFKDYPTDLKTLSSRLKKLGIKHTYRIHPLDKLEPQAKKILGFSVAGTHQIKIKDISIIRGLTSWGMFELYGDGFECERFKTETQVIKALKKHLNATN